MIPRITNDASPTRKWSLISVQVWSVDPLRHSAQLTPGREIPFNAAPEATPSGSPVDSGHQRLSTPRVRRLLLFARLAFESPGP